MEKVEEETIKLSVEDIREITGGRIVCHWNELLFFPTDEVIGKIIDDKFRGMLDKAGKKYILEKFDMNIEDWEFGIEYDSWSFASGYDAQFSYRKELSKEY